MYSEMKGEFMYRLFGSEAYDIYILFRPILLSLILFFALFFIMGFNFKFKFMS